MTPEVVYYVATSLDGYIATPDGGVEWLTPFQTGSEDYGYANFYRSIDALVMGSRTYEVSLDLGPWPSPDKPTWVFTRRQLRIAHPSVTLTSAEPGDLLRQLAQRGLKHVWLMGGGQLASSFRADGLISQYIIAVVPVFLGTGIALFAAGSPSDALTLSDVKSHSSGIVQLSYEPRRGA
jgi:dihydrofolate reductase